MSEINLMPLSDSAFKTKVEKPGNLDKAFSKTLIFPL